MPKFDPSRPVQTRDGRKARIVCVDMKRDHYPILALVENPNGLESAIFYTTAGSNFIDGTVHAGDLVNIPRPRPHADLIRQWAEDDTVTVEILKGTDWHVIFGTPGWSESATYRIKPA